MPSYNYAAVNPEGKKIRGTMVAENELDLENRLKELALDLVSSRITREKKASALGRVRIQDIIVMCLHLEQLERAGVPLLDAIADVRDSTESPKLRDVMAAIYESVKNGEMFSQALAHHPKVFNDVFVGLIAAGEKTGNLAESFNRLSDHLKWTNDIHRKIRKAIGYPAVLLLLMSGVISVLMIFVVPKLIGFIESQGFDIPFHTKALIFVSGIFADYWYLVFGIPIGIGVVLTGWYNVSESFAYKVDALILKIPVIGKTARKINMARFTHFFATMFKSGIDVLDALQASRNVVSNRVIQQSIVLARTSVSEGNSLTASLQMSNQFPNLVIRMFKVGEDSGNMNDALENINFFYNREVNDAVDTMVGMIQPTLTIVMGAMIFWVVSSVFGPLYETFSKMKF